MTHQAIRVILADDHPVVLDGLRSNLEPARHIQVVGTARSFAEVETLLASTPADVLVLDLGGMGGPPLSFVQKIRDERPGTHVIVFSSSIDLAPEMLQAGALGYMVKEDLSSQLVNAVTVVAAGKPWRSTVVEEYLERAAGVPQFHQFSPRELTVLKLLSQGKSTVEIGELLDIDPRTVQNYITGLRRKTGCEGRTQLVHWYQRAYEGGKS